MSSPAQKRRPRDFVKFAGIVAILRGRGPGRRAAI